MAEQTEFKFPDEVVTQEAKDAKIPEYEIEVVDDTPAQDQGRKPMTEAPTEPTEEELAQYSESARKRIQHFTKGYHEERRDKEAAQREREEALRYAQQLTEENKRLQGSLGQGQTVLLEQAKKVVDGELEKAKAEFKKAHEAGDTDALLSAQEALTTAKIKADRLNNFRPTPRQAAPSAVQTESSVQAPTPSVDLKAQAWRNSNSWFGSNDEMTAVALAVHRELVQKHADTSSDSYYEAINQRMKKRFPEEFSDASTSETTKKETKPATVVAPATRTTAPRKIVLTQSQVNIAKRLNVPLDVYAKQVAEIARKQNG